MLLIKKWLKDVTGTEAQVEHPTSNQFGDYTTNIAMILAKELKKSPNIIAMELKSRLDEIVDKKIVSKIDIVGGYINFYLTTDYLIKEIENFNLSKYGQGKTVVVDYSAPNIAKPFGIGHLRSTNIGQAIYNIYQALGWKCIGDNHLGDWGTQFGKMIVALKHWGPKDENYENLKIADLEKLYVQFHDEAEKDETLKKEGQQWFAKLEQGDSEARKIWQNCVDVSLKEFNRVYDLLGVKIDFAHGEAFYEPMLKDIVGQLKDANITKESQGALIVEFSDLPPAILQKSDGATTYFTRDMATIKYRLDEWKPDLCIYEVGSEQVLHFKQVFKAAEMMGWTKSMALYHLPHGLIRWSTGKFSTRKGDTIHLQQIIDKAMEGAKNLADTSQINKNLTNDEKADMVRKVAIGAIKFTDLTSDPRKDIIFDWDRMMDLSGDSGPYLQYTYARCQSVLGKATKAINNQADYNQDELALIQELFKYEEKVVDAADKYNPSIIAEYLLSVARKYNEFYGKYRIIGQPEESHRLWLTSITANTLKSGLGLLGIETVEKM